MANSLNSVPTRERLTQSSATFSSSALNSLCDRVNPKDLDQWFAPEHQQPYIKTLVGRIGLTRRRAECFVRLSAYLLLKEELEQQTIQPITELQLPKDYVICTHREAADLFYGDKERGSDRSAGMMLDQLAALGLIDKKFDGNTICIQILSIPDLSEPEPEVKPTQFKPDAFDPRTDAVPIANLMVRTYGWLMRDMPMAQQKMVRVLRQWAKEYPQGMRVLRCCQTLQPVGMAVHFPIASESEQYFFLPPSKSFYLSNSSEVDPFQIAKIGDLDCTAAYVRVWVIDPQYMSRENVTQFLIDTQQVLKQMQENFPSLFDLYVVVIHPVYLDGLASAMGFRRTTNDTQTSAYWMYQAVDHFLAIDVKQAIDDFPFGNDGSQ